MLLRRVSLITDENQKLKDSWRRRTQDPTRAEIEKRIDGADVTKSDKLEEEKNRPQLREENAMLQIPSFKKAGPLVSPGGSTFQRKWLPRELVREKGPAKHVGESGEIAFPTGGGSSPARGRDEGNSVHFEK